MSNEKISNKSKVISVVSAAVIAVISLLVSVIVFNTKDFGIRRTFYFYSIDKKDIATEMRFLSRNPQQGDVQFFVDELVLGPITNRFQRIFPAGTKVQFCTLQDDVLYVGLSEDALKGNSSMEDLSKSIDLFKVNIVKNFTKINTVMVYIDGKSVWNDA